MRTLHLPQISTTEVRSESDVFSHLMVMRALREMEHSYFYLWLRRGDEDAEMEEQDVACFYRERERDFYRQMAIADMGALSELFSWGEGLYPVDAVFTSRAGIGPVMALGLGMGAGSAPMPVVLTEPRVYAPGEPSPHNDQSEVQFAVRASGYACCFGMYWSKWEKESALATAERYVSSAVLKGWDDRAFVVDAPVSVAMDLDVPRPETPKKLLFAGRINSNKRPEAVLEAYAKVVQSRSDTVAWVHAGTGAFTKLEPFSGHRWHRTSEKLPRDEYHDLIKTAHVGVYLSGDEGANVTVQELVASGVTMVLPNRPWVYKLFHPHEYPYTADEHA